MEDDHGCCGICGVDPVVHQAIDIGITVIDMCEECYGEFLQSELDAGTEATTK